MPARGQADEDRAAPREQSADHDAAGSADQDAHSAAADSKERAVALVSAASAAGKAALSPAGRRSAQRQAIDSRNVLISAAVHVLLKRRTGGGGAAQRKVPSASIELLKKALKILAADAEMKLPAVWLARSLNAALRDKCQYKHCTIAHGEEALQVNDNHQLKHLRLTTIADFKGAKNAGAACVAAYDHLSQFIPSLCSAFTEAKHNEDNCSALHIDFGLEQTATDSQDLLARVVSRLLGVLCVYTGLAKAKAASLTLLDQVEIALSVAGLPKQITAKSAGGTLNRHALGRAITASEHWCVPGTNERQRPVKRAFPGWQVKHLDVGELQGIVAREFGADAESAASASAPASAPASAAAAAAPGSALAPPPLIFGNGSVTLPADAFAAMMVHMQALMSRR